MGKRLYSNYLESDEWKEKRSKVRRRARGWCERCKVRRREDVHHLTYQNVGNEKLTELVGVCRKCHEFLHGLRAEDPAATAFSGEEIRLLRNVDGGRAVTVLHAFLACKMYASAFYLLEALRRRGDDDLDLICLAVKGLKAKDFGSWLIAQF